MSPIIIKHFDNHYIFKKIQKENSFMIKIGKELIKRCLFSISQWQKHFQ